MQELRELAPGPEILFMVKANAYGHGLLRIVDYCFKELQITSFGLASLGEALWLRRASENYQCELYLFSDFALEEHWRDCLDYKLLPVVAHRKDLLFLLDHEQCRHLPLALHFNTGMNRLGLPWEKCHEVARELRRRGRSVYHLMTHFSDSFSPQKKKTARQYHKFLQLKEAFDRAGVPVEKTSVANSGAIENGIGLEESTIRPGLFLYGIQSTLEPPQRRGKLVSALYAEVLDIRLIAPGSEVGYGSTPVPEHWGKDAHLYILGLGYGDGIDNRYQKLSLHFQHTWGEILGQVNMDMLQVIFPGKLSLQRGDLFPLWSSSQEFLAIAQHTGMTPYEITCEIDSRVPRIYRDAE